MKPLLKKDITNFLERFNFFKDSDLRSLDIITPTTVQLTFAAQDEAKEFDWVSVILEFSNVSDAKLLESTKLSFVDMSDGVSILHQDGNFAFGVGRYDSINSLESSICKIISNTLKYDIQNF